MSSRTDLSYDHDSPYIVSAVLFDGRYSLCLPIAVERFIALGYPGALGASLREYIESMPREPRPANRTTMGRRLVLVDPRVDVRYQLSAAGIIAPVDLSRLRDVVSVPSRPYWIAVRCTDGDEEQCDRERGLTVIEGVSVAIHCSGNMRHNRMLLAGSRFEGRGTPCFMDNPWPRAAKGYHLIGTL